MRDPFAPSPRTTTETPFAAAPHQPLAETPHHVADPQQPQEEVCLLRRITKGVKVIIAASVSLLLLYWYICISTGSCSTIGSIGGTFFLFLLVALPLWGLIAALGALLCEQPSASASSVAKGTSGARRTWHWITRGLLVVVALLPFLLLWQLFVQPESGIFVWVFLVMGIQVAILLSPLLVVYVVWRALRAFSHPTQASALHAQHQHEHYEIATAGATVSTLVHWAERVAKVLLFAGVVLFGALLAQCGPTLRSCTVSWLSPGGLGAIFDGAFRVLLLVAPLMIAGAGVRWVVLTKDKHKLREVLAWGVGSGLIATAGTLVASAARTTTIDPDMVFLLMTLTGGGVGSILGYRSIEWGAVGAVAQLATFTATTIILALMGVLSSVEKAAGGMLVLAGAGMVGLIVGVVFRALRGLVSRR